MTITQQIQSAKSVEELQRIAEIHRHNTDFPADFLRKSIERLNGRIPVGDDHLNDDPSDLSNF